MPYASVADIQAEFRNTDFNAVGVPVNTAKVTEFIAQESNTIDAKLANKYKVPVVEADSPLAFSVLKKLCIAFVKDRIKPILEISAPQPIGDQQVAPVYTGVRSPGAEMKAIQNGETLLLDAIFKQTGDEVAFTSVTNRPQFRPGCDQW